MKAALKLHSKSIQAQHVDAKRNLLFFRLGSFLGELIDKPSRGTIMDGKEQDLISAETLYFCKVLEGINPRLFFLNWLNLFAV
jgi:hypothetical protein